MFTMKGCSLIRGVHYERFHCTQKQCSNWKYLSFLIIGHVCMDGTPVDNNRLVLASFLNTLTVRASPSLSASQYPKDRKSCITTEKNG